MSIFKYAVVSSIAIMATTPFAYSQPPDPPAPVAKPAPVLPGEKIYHLRAMDASPDGKWLAATGGVFVRRGQSNVYRPAGTQVKVWEVVSGRTKWEASREGNANNLVIFSPDSSRLLFTSTQNRQGASKEPLPHLVQVVEMAESGKVVTLELVADEHVREPFFSPDSRHVLALPMRTEKSPKREGEYSYDKWDATTGKRMGPLPNISPQEKALGFRDGGQTLVTSQQMYVERKFAGIEIKTRSWPELKLLHSTMLESSKTGLTLLSPDGKRVAIQNILQGGADFDINIWNTQTGKLETPFALDVPELSTDMLGFSSDSQALIGSRVKFQNAAPAGHTFLFWDVQTGVFQPWSNEEFKPDKFRASREILTFFSSDGKSYFTKGMNDSVEHRSLADGKLIRVFE